MRLIDIDGLKGCAIIRPHSIEDMKAIKSCSERILHDDIPTACDTEQYEKCWKEGFNDGYIHGLEIAIIETENTIGRTKKAEKLCAILQEYKINKGGEQE